LPNSSRTAATSTLTGFHWAIVCSAVGSESTGTNALLRNVSGNTTTKPTPITASGVRTLRPRKMPIHTITDANSRIRTIASRLGPTSWGRQPTMRPVPRTTTIDTAMPSSSARNCPLRYAPRGVGSVRKRSTTPSPMSVAIAVAGPISPNANDWMRMPPTRYSR
jgi:hypothetical protein